MKNEGKGSFQNIGTVGRRDSPRVSICLLPLLSQYAQTPLPMPRSQKPSNVSGLVACKRTGQLWLVFLFPPVSRPSLPNSPVTRLVQIHVQEAHGVTILSSCYRINQTPVAVTSGRGQSYATHHASQKEPCRKRRKTVNLLCSPLVKEPPKLPSLAFYSALSLQLLVVFSTLPPIFPSAVLRLHKVWYKRCLKDLK